jgi:TolB-like protein/uncharacterized membrane protein YhaH (DUF805 family)
MAEKRNNIPLSKLFEPLIWEGRKIRIRRRSRSSFARELLLACLSTIICAGFLAFYVYYFARYGYRASVGELAFLAVFYILVAIAIICSFLFPVLGRLRDMDASPLWVLLTYIPIANIIFWIVLLFVKGTVGPNSYGPDPLDPNEIAGGRRAGKQTVIAVLPFHNMTDNRTWDLWQDGIQKVIVLSLTNSGKLIVRPIAAIDSSFQSTGVSKYTTMKPAIASQISKGLGVAIAIYGTIQQSGLSTRVDAKIINTQTNEIIKECKVVSPPEGQLIVPPTYVVSIVSMVTSLSDQVRDFLEQSRL